MVRASLPEIGLGATMTAMLYCDSMVVKATGKRSAGKLHAAFEEGDQGVTLVSTLPGLLVVIKLQRTELREVHDELKKSAVAQLKLVEATTDAQRISYASSLIPLIEASRNELIGIMESSQGIPMLRDADKTTVNVNLDTLFQDFRYVGQNLEFNTANDVARRTSQRISDRLFSIYSLCQEVTEKTESQKVESHYLHVVGDLILSLNPVGGLVTPSYSTPQDFTSMTTWAQSATGQEDEPSDQGE